jgi:hypothetical protein
MAHEPTQIEILEQLATPAFNGNPSSLLLNPLYIQEKRELFKNLMIGYKDILVHLITTLPYVSYNVSVRIPPAIIVGGAAAALLCNYQFDTPDIDVNLVSLNIPEEEGQPTYRNGALIPSYNDYMNFIFDHLVTALPTHIASFEMLEDITDADVSQDSELRHRSGDPAIIGGKLYVAKLVGIDFITYTPGQAPTITYTSKIIIMVKYRGYTERILEMKLPTRTNEAVPSYTAISPILFVSSNPTLLDENLYVLEQKLIKMRRACRDYNENIRQLIDQSPSNPSDYALRIEKQLRDAILLYKVRISTHIFRIGQLMVKLYNGYLFSLREGNIAEATRILSYLTNFNYIYNAKKYTYPEFFGYAVPAGPIFAWLQNDKTTLTRFVNYLRPPAGGFRRKQTKKRKTRGSKLIKQTKRR